MLAKGFLVLALWLFEAFYYIKRRPLFEPYDNNKEKKEAKEEVAMLLASSAKEFVNTTAFADLIFGGGLTPEKAKTIVANSSPDKDDYGISSHNPVCVAEEKDCDFFLNCLTTRDGESIVWNYSGWENVNNCNSVDCVTVKRYDINDDSNNNIFICVVGENKYWAPKGFALQNREVSHKYDSDSCDISNGDTTALGEENKEESNKKVSYCRKCGKRLGFGAFSFCRYCGEKLAAGFANSEDESKEVISASTEDIGDQLRGYSKLLDEGLITQEDYDRKKRQLMGI